MRHELTVVRDLLAGDPVINQLADNGVGAHHDKDRRGLAVGFELAMPVVKRLLVAAMQAAKGPLQLRWW